MSGTKPPATSADPADCRSRPFASKGFALDSPAGVPLLLGRVGHVSAWRDSKSPLATFPTLGDSGGPTHRRRESVRWALRCIYSSLIWKTGQRHPMSRPVCCGFTHLLCHALDSGPADRLWLPSHLLGCGDLNSEGLNSCSRSHSKVASIPKPMLFVTDSRARQDKALVLCGTKRR